MKWQLLCEKIVHSPPVMRSSPIFNNYIQTSNCNELFTLDILLLEFSNRRDTVRSRKVLKQAHRCFFLDPPKFPFQKTVYNFTSRMQLFTFSCTHAYIRLTIRIVCNHSQLPSIVDMDKSITGYVIHGLLQSVHSVGPTIVVDRRDEKHSQHAKAEQLRSRWKLYFPLAFNANTYTDPSTRNTKLNWKRLVEFDELQGCMFAITLVAIDSRWKSRSYRCIHVSFGNSR